MEPAARGHRSAPARRAIGRRESRRIMTVYKSVSELIGGTPLVELTNYE